MKSRNLIKDFCKRKLETFLLHESLPPPTVYFLVFLYAHSNMQICSPDMGLIIFLFAITTALCFNFNFLFTMAPFINYPSLPLGFFMIICCTFACNQKWKAYLFVVAIGDSLFTDPLANAIFLAAIASFICQQAHQRLVFRTINDNKHFFIGFLAIVIHYLLDVVKICAQLEIQSGISIVLLVLSIGLGYSIMQKRVFQLRNTEIGIYKDSRIIAHFLKLFEESIKSQEFIHKAKVMLHMRICSNPLCFCLNPMNSNQTEYFLRQMYDNTVRTGVKNMDSLLLQNYTEFLTKNQLTINALHFLSQSKSKSYFFYIAKIRSIAKIKDQLRDETSFNEYEKEYQYALTYDKLCAHLVLEINQVLKNKLIFWREVCKESPLLKKLQTVGTAIIDRMYTLNTFYNLVSKKYESRLYSFDATILYGMYLLSTTNFKQYAEIIIKNTSKLLEEVEICENKVAQTYSIRTVVQDSKKYHSLSQQSAKLLSPLNEQTKDTRYKLIIDSVSGGFCRMLKTKKTVLIGRQLNTIIPEGYRAVHNSRLNYLLDFQNQKLNDVMPSKILHRQIKLPIRGANKQLYMGLICIKILADVEVGLTFMACIKRIHGKTTSLMISFTDQITEIEEGFNLEIIQHSETKKYLEKIKQSWQQQRVMKEESFNIMMNSTNFGVYMSSPLLSLFLDKENMKNVAPPIHVEVINEQKNRRRKFDYKSNDMVNQLKQIERVIITDNESTTSSKSSTSAINILSTFAEGNTISVYKYIQVVFVIVIIACLGANLAGYMTSNLQWDNSSKDFNPITDILRTQQIELLTARVLLNVGDLLAYNLQSNNFNYTRISSYSPTRDYITDIMTIFNNSFGEMKKNIYSILANASNILKNPLENYWNTKVQTVSASIMPTNTQRRNQTLTFLELMMNYALDINLMSHNTLVTGVMFYETYTTAVVDNQNATSIRSFIDTSIKHSKDLNILVQLILCGTIFLLLIPFALSLKGRVKVHQKIFDLIVSIESNLVEKQMNSLEYILNILHNYQETNQVLKVNVLGYQDNVKLPTKINSRNSSLSNEVIIGLEKYDRHQSSLKGDQPLEKQSQNNTNQQRQTDSVRSQLKKFTLIGSEGFKQMIFNTKNRKRDGELNLSGSESDPQEKINSKHWFIYLTIVIFTAFLGMSTYYNNSYFDSVKSKKQVLINMANVRVADSLNFLVGKVYLRAGFSGVKTQFSSQMAYYYLLMNLPYLPRFQISDETDMTEIYQSCYDDKNQMNFKARQLFCRYDYSYKVLHSQFFTLLKQLFEAKALADKNLANYVKNNQTAKYQQIISSINEKIFYMQSLGNKMQKAILMMIETMTDDMIQDSKNYNIYKQTIFLLSFGWFLISFSFGMSSICLMKKQYFKEAYMITFLSNEMIMKNKRVESFLDSLSKNIEN